MSELRPLDVSMYTTAIVTVERAPEGVQMHYAEVTNGEAIPVEKAATARMLRELADQLDAIVESQA
jgi:hypothetical protein